MKYLSKTLTKNLLDVGTGASSGLVKISLIVGLFLLPGLKLMAQSNDDCAMCHDDPELFTIVNGREVSRYIPAGILDKSVHSYLECISCHTDADVEEFPHADKLQPVNCGDCHDEAMTKYMDGVHGIAFEEGDKNSPNCAECHGTHEILSSADPQSRTYKMNIPILCGTCHREGAPVARAYNIGEHNIVENYTQGIHGKGLFGSGLVVTATCNNCHGNHLILPHTNMNSSISEKNIAATCMQCHARIEDVHIKIINKELWEKSPGAIPACTDCHPPHKVELKNIIENISDKTCLKCHEQPDIHKVVDEEQVSLYVDVNEFVNSAHNNITCVKCHSDVTANIARPCETSDKVDCSSCHAEESDIYFQSGHGKAYFAKHENAPYCTDCHGSHHVIPSENENSPTFRSEVPKLCGECHKENGQAVEGTNLKETNAYYDYSTSVHGRSLEEKGLLAAAICTDCHTTHFMLKEEDERSSVNPANLAKTCGNCHKGIYDQYMDSEHGISANTEELKFPTCETCHSAHNISEVHESKFMSEISSQCGQCHEDLAETYLETYHGKVYQLGYLDAARCSDCHGAHNIYRMDNPKSTISPRNIVETCSKCHTDANMKFTGYLTHATHYDKSNFPWLYYTFWAMTGLLLSVFAFFGLHTLLWIPRSLGAMINKRKEPKPVGKQMYIRRFQKKNRITHIFVIISFIMLALTGMILKFAYMDWAKFLAEVIGGAHVAGFIHRTAALVTFGYFVFHVVALLKVKFKKGIKVSKFIFSSNSLMFNRKDIRDFWASIKWFIGVGPRPEYGRWTYWEKFDYFAVFWGVLVIGSTGLMLWFPEFFTKFLPGWLINVAQIIHSDEALLAVGFIFTIHFFNTHLRPESFPMDTAIFTGYVLEKEYKKDRPHEYEQLVKSGKIDDVRVEKEFTKEQMRTIKIFGFTALFAGVIMILLIIYSLIFH